MASFQADTGLTGSVVGSLFGGQSAASPPRTFVPEGPTSLSAAAYGSGASSAGGGGMQPGTHALIAGMVAFGLLVGMWLSLPR